MTRTDIFRVLLLSSGVLLGGCRSVQSVDLDGGRQDSAADGGTLDQLLSDAAAPDVAADGPAAPDTIVGDGARDDGTIADTAPPDLSPPHDSVIADQGPPVDSSVDSCASPCGASCCGAQQTCLSGSICCDDSAICGSQCCKAGQLCLADTGLLACATPPAGATLLYATTAKYDGNLGGRAGADAKCAADQPAELSCQATVRALLSVEIGDELQGMPSSYGFDAARPLYFWHTTKRQIRRLADDWAHALNAVATPILVTPADGTGVPDHYWTGSYTDGALAYNANYNYACHGWTTSSPMGTVYATDGDSGSKSHWITHPAGYVGCNGARYLLCACRR